VIEGACPAGLAAATGNKALSLPMREESPAREDEDRRSLEARANTAKIALTAGNCLIFDCLIVIGTTS